jgi:uncharacterized protein (UPF0548 family)
VLAARLDLDHALERATAHETSVRAGWLAAPPPGFDTLHRSIVLPDRTDLHRCGAALLDWALHRASGLSVRSDGAARAGGTVVVATRLGPVWVLAPCRVISVTESADRVSLAYATLPGHPEHGVEEFLFLRDDAGTRFEVRAVSTPTVRVSRVLPFPQRAVQRLFTTRYLRSAAALAGD